MINKEIFDLFQKYGSELLWLDDPRVSRPKETNKETDDAFVILSRVDENLELFYNENYSDELKRDFEVVINKFKIFIEPEVFELMKNKYR